MSTTTTEKTWKDFPRVPEPREAEEMFETIKPDAMVRQDHFPGQTRATRLAASPGPGRR